MPDRIIAECAPAHPSKTEETLSLNDTGSPTAAVGTGAAVDLLTKSGEQNDQALQSAVAVVGEHPERAPELAEQLGIGADVAEMTSEASASVGQDEEEDADKPKKGDAEDDEEDRYDSSFDEKIFRNLHNVSVEPYVLELSAPGEAFIRSLVLAFCSNADKPEGVSADLSPLPHKADRSNKNLFFKVNTDTFAKCPTLTGWTFQKGDDLEIWGIDRDYGYLAGEVAVVVVGENLTLCEIRKTGEDEDGEDILRLFNLATGELLPYNSFLIIGEVWGTQRKYNGPETAHDRAMRRVLKDAADKERTTKHARPRRDPMFAHTYERAFKEEEALEAASGGTQQPEAPAQDPKIAELTDLLRNKIRLGALDPDVITAGGYWTMEHFDAAARLVRLELDPRYYVPFYAAIDKGLSMEEADVAAGFAERGVAK